MQHEVAYTIHRHLVAQLKKDTINDPIDLIRFAWDLLQVIEGFERLSHIEKKEAILHAIENIAAGPDGLLNTPDDVIPPRILKGLEAMIDNDILVPALDLILETAQVKRGMTVCRWLSGLFSLLCCCAPAHTPTGTRAPLIQSRS